MATGKLNAAVKLPPSDRQRRRGLAADPVSSPVKFALRTKGWSYRRAAQELGISYQYLSDVANGHRRSLRLAARVQALPEAPTAFAE